MRRLGVELYLSEILLSGGLFAWGGYVLSALRQQPSAQTMGFRCHALHMPSRGRRVFPVRGQAFEEFRDRRHEIDLQLLDRAGAAGTMGPFMAQRLFCRPQRAFQGSLNAKVLLSPRWRSRF
jgi:hypothetical protein